jgi:multidrug efflux pump subunit AcrA (membrane-fusion protein)
MRARLIFPATLALLVAACGAKDAGPQGPQGPPPVTVATPLIKPIVDWDDYVGRFEAKQSVEVRPRITGQVARLAFQDGQFVRAGDLLFVIDPRPFEAALAQAKAEAQRARASAELARSTFARTSTLFARTPSAGRSSTPPRQRSARPKRRWPLPRPASSRGRLIWASPVSRRQFRAAPPIGVSMSARS